MLLVIRYFIYFKLKEHPSTGHVKKLAHQGLGKFLLLGADQQVQWSLILTALTYSANLNKYYADSHENV